MIKKGFSYIGIFFLKILSYLPFSILYGISSFVYYLIYYVIGYRRKVVRKNLVNSFPELPVNQLITIEKKFYQHLTDMIFENVKLYSIGKEEIKKRVQFTGLEKVNEIYNSGRNVMMCTGHYGNWEMISLSLSLNNPSKTVVIYKPLTNKVYEQWFNGWRTKFGAIFVPMRQTLRMVEGLKNEPFMLCFASDQSPVKEDATYFLDFLNQPTAALLGIEKISKRTQSPIFYFVIKRVKRGYYEVDCVPICAAPENTAVHEITNLHFSFLEQMIKADPAYWLWSHNRWKHKPQIHE